MPYVSKSVGTSPVTFASIPKVSRAKPTGLKIHNADTNDRVLTGTDVFQPDPSVNVSSPTAQTQQWLQISVGSQLTADIPRSEVEEARLLGDVKFAADSVTANSPVVSLFYELE